MKIKLRELLDSHYYSEALKHADRHTKEYIQLLLDTLAKIDVPEELLRKFIEFLKITSLLDINDVFVTPSEENDSILIRLEVPDKYTYFGRSLLDASLFLTLEIKDKFSLDEQIKLIPVLWTYSLFVGEDEEEDEEAPVDTKQGLH